MLYLVEIEDGELKVELDEPRRGAWRARVGDQQADAFDLELLGRDEDGGFLVRVNGVERVFHLDRNCTRHLLSEGQLLSRVRVEHAADIVLQHDHLHHDQDSTVIEDVLVSPITGIVLDVLVEDGQHVEQGTPVLVIEAMKMENTLMACATGAVADLSARVGQTVYAGDRLLRIDC